MNFSRRLACFYKKFQDVYLSTQFEFEGLENEIYNSVFLLFCELSSVFSLSSSKSKVDKNIVVSNGID